VRADQSELTFQNALSIVADAGITFAIVYGLHKNKTGWKHTDSHLKGLIM
jgi:hypothetical protein